MKKSKTLTGLGFALGLAAAVIGSPASATVVDVGFNNNGDCTFGCVARYQQVYSASLFAPGPVTISQVAFFAFENFTIAPRTFQMILSTSTATVGGGLSATFASNHGGDQSLFSTTTFSGTYADGDLIAFDGSFSYDPSGGDLLVDIIADAVAFERPFVWASQDPNYQRAYSFDSTVTADGVNQDNYGDRTRFTFSDPNGVPEPGTLVLAALGLLAIARVSRRTA